MKIPLKILVADDEIELRQFIQEMISNKYPNCICHEAQNGEDVLKQMEKTQYDLIFLDVKMPILTGIDVLKQSSLPSTCHAIIVTAHGNVKDAVEAIKFGAYDYLEKPLRKEKLFSIVDQSLKTKQLIKEVALSRPVTMEGLNQPIIGSSPSMKSIFDLIAKVSKIESTVLLRGENGTGKELIAQAIHFNSSRKRNNFVAINCAALPDDLIESELFGHEKGAFTGADSRKIGKFQLANDGTFFLDEIGELKPNVQAKLLRVLQEKSFTPVGSTREQKTNARIISATNQNLEDLMKQNLFREDLFFRLNVMPIYIPALRERKEDIPHLIDHFTKKHNEENRSNLSFDKLALKHLVNFYWPGNIRQLENIIQRLVLLNPQKNLQIEDLPGELFIPIENKKSEGMDFEKFKEESEKLFIEKALLKNKGKINQTVTQANIPKNTLLRKIKKYGINVKDFLKKTTD